MFGIFFNAFLRLNWQSFPFNDNFRVEKVKLAIYFYLCDDGLVKNVRHV